MVSSVATGRRAAVGRATIQTSQGASDSLAPGCTITYDGIGGASAFYNTKQTKQCCYGLTYGLCFGVELTMNNKVVLYFYTYYALSPRTSGVLGSCFGLMNLFARSWGGLLSDALSKKFGIRGRIWAMWITQTIEGGFCILMGLVTVGYDGPDDFDYKITTGEWSYKDGRDTIAYTFNTSKSKIDKCGSKQLKTPEYGFVEGVWTRMPHDDPFIMIRDPNDECLHAQAPLAVAPEQLQGHVALAAEGQLEEAQLQAELGALRRVAAEVRNARNEQAMALSAQALCATACVRPMLQSQNGP